MRRNDQHLQSSCWPWAPATQGHVANQTSSSPQAATLPGHPAPRRPFSCLRSLLDPFWLRGQNRGTMGGFDTPWWTSGGGKFLYAPTYRLQAFFLERARVEGWVGQPRRSLQWTPRYHRPRAEGCRLTFVRPFVDTFLCFRPFLFPARLLVGRG